MTFKANKQLIKRRFNRSQATYTQTAAIQQQMARTLIKQLKRIKNCHYPKALEVGIGTGILTDLIHQLLSVGHLWGNDIIDDHYLGLTPFIENGWLTYLPGDAESLTREEQSLDLIASNATIQWFENPLSTLNNWLQWLKPEGILAFTTFGQDNFALLNKLTGKRLNYLSWQMFTQTLSNKALCLWFHEEHHILNFPTFIDLLKHIKSTGVNAISRGTALVTSTCPAEPGEDRCHVPTNVWTRTYLKQLAKHYEKSNQLPGEFSLHYHPYWFIFQKQGLN